jgi:hypothetical protein
MLSIMDIAEGYCDIELRLEYTKGGTMGYAHRDS